MVDRVRSPLTSLAAAGSLTAVLLLGGCLSVRPQEVQVRTEPPGAQASSASGERCTTPCTLHLPRVASQLVRLELTGFESVDVPLTGTLWRSGSAASLGGSLFGGLGGVLLTAALIPLVGVDSMADGAMLALVGFGSAMSYIGSRNERAGAGVKLEPNPIHVVLEPSPPSDGPPRPPAVERIP